MNDLLQSPMFGILLSLIAFEIGLWIQKKTKQLWLNPLLLAIAMVILVLLIFQIDLPTYQIGGDIINLFLGPATVVLAVPLYQHLEDLKNYFKPIMIGIFIGILVGLAATLTVSFVMGFDQELMASLLPKSITTPIGIELSKELGGIPSITVLTILVSGVFGAIMAEVVFRIFNITHPIAKGIAIGTSAHAVGTSKALQLGKVEGAMSSLAIGVAGIATVCIVPVIWSFLRSLM